MAVITLLVLMASKMVTITPQVLMARESPSNLIAAAMMVMHRASLMANTSVNLEVNLMATILTSHGSTNKRVTFEIPVMSSYGHNPNYGHNSQGQGQGWTSSHPQVSLNVSCNKYSIFQFVILYSTYCKIMYSTCRFTLVTLPYCTVLYLM